MPMTFALARTIDVSGGFVADAAPSTTNPAATQIYSVKPRAVDAVGGPTRSVLIYVRLVTASSGADVPAGTATYTVWMRDAGAGPQLSASASKAGKDRWVGGASHATVASGVVVQEKMLGELFVQLTAASLGGATSIEVWIGESSTS